MLKTNREHAIGYMMVFLASILFGSYGVWSKLMGEGEFGIYYQGWVRALIVLILLTPFMIYTKKLRLPKRKDWKWFAIFLGFTVFTQVPLYYGFINTGVGAATLMFYGMYLITSYIIGRFMIGEKITLIKLVSLLLAFAGMAFVYSGATLVFSAFGLIMAALNGIASGGEVSSSKMLTKDYDSITPIYYSWVVILLTHLPLSLLFGETQYIPVMNVAWGAMLAYSVAGLLSFWLVVEGYKHIDASIGGLIGVAEIVWGVLFGIWLFNESMGPYMAIGVVLILVAGMLPHTAKLPNKLMNPKT